MVSHIPFSLGCLRNLQTLYMRPHKGLLPSKSKPQLLDIFSRRKVGFVPPSFVNLCSLKHLIVSYHYLGEVDLGSSLGSLNSLENLDLSGRCYLQSLPFSLSHLSNLRRLFLKNWRNLRALEDLPPNLHVLSTENCVSLEKIEDFSNLKKLRELNFENCKSLVELPGVGSLESLKCLAIANCSALSIPLIENWYQARCEGDNLKIWVQVIRYVSSVSCRIPTHWRKYGFEMLFPLLNDDHINGVGVSVRSKSSGAWIVKEPLKYIGIEEYEEIEIEIPTRIEEVMEVYAHFHDVQKILCVVEIHRNRDGEVRFFPSTRGWISAASLPTHQLQLHLLE